MLGLAKDLKRIFSTCPAEDEELCLLAVASAALAQAGVLPAPLAELPERAVLLEYCTAVGLPKPRLDDSKFALAGASLFSSRAIAVGSDAQAKRVAEALGHSALKFRAEDVGWMHQCLMKLNHLNPPNRSRRALHGELAQLTQWFTPKWIADFLACQCLADKSQAVFLDPAVGAGHLLSSAFQTLRDLRANDSEAVEQILGGQLFGIDIDADLIKMANFVLYLDARKVNREEAFSLPHLYSITCSDLKDRTFGSLWLGAQERPKDLQLLRVDGEKFSLSRLPRSFDAIAMNPPYLSHRFIPDDIAQLLAQYYPHSRYDLYAAFLDMAVSLLAPGGRLSAICQQSFLTVQRYYGLRTRILRQTTLRSMVHLGAGAFATKDGEKVNNAIVVIEAADPADTDVIDCRSITSSAAKLIAEDKGIAQTESTKISRAHSHSLLNLIPNGPLVFWAPEEVLKQFALHPPLENSESGVVCTNGLFTCDNNKFVKHVSDVGEHERSEYVPYDKGGGHKWYRTSNLLLHWQGNGDAIRAFRASRGQSTSLPGEAYYFKPGITYSYIGTRGFAARMLTPNAVFDIASSAVFSSSPDLDLYYLLGWLNSSLVRCMLGILNPTINFQIGDVRRLPLAMPDQKSQLGIAECAREAVALAKEMETHDPISATYECRETADLHELQHHWHKRERALQELIDDQIFEIYEISAVNRRRVLSDPWAQEKKRK